MEHADFDESLYLGFRDGRNIMEACASQFCDLSTLDHAPVAHERHPFAAKALGDLHNLGRQGAHIGGISEAKTSVSTGAPSSSHNNPMTTCFLPALPSRL